MARSPHFEVYSQAGETGARSILLAFERLRAFFQQQTGWVLDNRPPLRVIVFLSAAEYTPYQIGPLADAYYSGTESSDYIVMIQPGAGDFHVAAHEYAHFVLRANGLDLPPWLGEGLPEYFSAVGGGIAGRAADLPARSQVLRRQAWMPLDELLNLKADSPLRQQRDSSEIFYAESWALTDMLMESAPYRSHLPELLQALAGGSPSPMALAAAYGRGLDQITSDLRQWVRQRKTTVLPLPEVSAGNGALKSEPLPPLAWRSLLAKLLLDTGRTDQAENAYQELARAAPTDPGFPAGLATIALQRKQWDSARREWQRALDLGINDAAVCYRYAVMANAAGFPAGDLQPALERAVKARPGFDDALFLLAHLESNASQYEAVVRHLRAMQQVQPSRQFSYWTLLADAWIALDQRDEALAAAREAGRHATTPDQRQHAAQLAVIAQTDPAVQYTRDANGNQHLVTTRVPHGTTDWNPFIEPDDQIRRVDGRLLEIDCSGRSPRIRVETPAGRLTVDIPDPKRVLMRNAPPEFTCGPQPPTSVSVTYAAITNPDGSSSGIAREIDFR